MNLGVRKKLPGLLAAGFAAHAEPEGSLGVTEGLDGTGTGKGAEGCSMAGSVDGCMDASLAEAMAIARSTAFAGFSKDQRRAPPWRPPRFFRAGDTVGAAPAKGPSGTAAGGDSVCPEFSDMDADVPLLDTGVTDGSCCPQQASPSPSRTGLEGVCVWPRGGSIAGAGAGGTFSLFEVCLRGPTGSHGELGVDLFP